MYHEITNYTSEMFKNDRQGQINERQRAYAAKVAAKKNRATTEDGNILYFTIYSSHKIIGGYSYTEYIFRPSTWETRRYDVRDNSTRVTRYAYD